MMPKPIRSLAQLRGRNVEWAVEAVREGASLSAEEALQQNVIDLIAAHVPDLLAQLDGREVQLIHEKHVLHTSGLTVKRIEPDWRNELLSLITNPNVAYVLMLIGIYGLIFEFATPGTLLPGIVGAVSLVLSLYAFQVLPISYAGLALMLFGLALLIAEAFAPSFGVLGIGGGLVFIIGSIFLMDTKATDSLLFWWECSAWRIWPFLLLCWEPSFKPENDRWSVERRPWSDPRQLRWKHLRLKGRSGLKVKSGRRVLLFRLKRSRL